MGGTAVGAANGGDVFVVAADGDFDISGIGEGVVGGIKADPAGLRKKDLGPCVGGLGADEMVFRAVVEVAGCVAGWNAGGAA